jgi:phosphoglycolate phosphatase-like HAD superfamily hydrolase
MVAQDLVCFDIDGTLLRTRGAGREALDEAFRRVMGWERATDGVAIAGSTDSAIVRDVVARFGAEGFDAAAVRAAYLEGLARRVGEGGRVEACLGVHAAIQAVSARAHVCLLTGNWREGADLKLGAVGLGGVFTFGAFGDDAAHRDGLVPVACARAAERGLNWRRVVVIGDTPADVQCARAAGAVAVAVETGFAAPEVLAAARPDLQLPDLSRGLGWLLALLD